MRASSMPRLAVELQVHTSSMTQPPCWILTILSHAKVSGSSASLGVGLRLSELLEQVVILADASPTDLDLEQGLN